jgi:hypothetical protein
MQCPECCVEVPFWRVLLMQLRLGGGQCSRCHTPFEPIFTLRACINMGLIAGGLFALAVWGLDGNWWLRLVGGLLGLFTGAVLIPALLVQIRVYPLKRKREGPDWMRSASGR